MKKFEFKQTFREFEVGSKVYKADFNDEKLNEYRKKFKEFVNWQTEISKVDESKLSEEKQLQHFDEIKEQTKKLLEMYLGEGTFDEIYEASGHSIMNVMDLIRFVASEADEMFLDKKRDYYLKDKKDKKKLEVPER